MAYTTIDKPTDYFNTVLYTGNGSTGHAITGVGFQPDWLWIKERSSTSAAFIYDVIRGVNVKLTPSTTDADSTVADSMTSFDSDGFTVGNNGATNESGQTVVAWNWLAGGSASSNSNGDITSSVSANTTAGFSIVKYSGNGTAGSTIGHGLGSVPSAILLKPLDRTDNWRVYHKGIDATAPQNYHLKLQSTSARADADDVWNDTAPTSSLFTVGGNAGIVASGEEFIAYCFSEKKGFSKFGSYTGNGQADGVFVYLGFKPSFVMTKCTSASGQSWHMQDNKRDGFNYNNHRLFANSSGAEETTVRMDLLSNGFKYRDGDGQTNGATYIYMAFAESPFVNSNGVPNNAR